MRSDVSFEIGLDCGSMASGLNLCRSEDDRLQILVTKNNIKHKDAHILFFCFHSMSKIGTRMGSHILQWRHCSICPFISGDEGVILDINEECRNCCSAEWLNWLIYNEKTYFSASSLPQTCPTWGISQQKKEFLLSLVFLYVRCFFVCFVFLHFWYDPFSVRVIVSPMRQKNTSSSWKAPLFLMGVLKKSRPGYAQSELGT